MNFGFDQADQSSRLGQKNNIQYSINHYPVYVSLVAGIYGKLYHAKTPWVRARFKHFSTKMKIEHVHWHAS